MKDDNWFIFIGGGIETLPGVLKAQSLGLKVIVTDMSEECTCASHADLFIRADIYDQTITLGKLKRFVDRKNNIVGVTCLGVDAPLTVAYVATEFNLRGPSIEAAKNTTNKLAFKTLFRTTELRIPDYHVVSSPSDFHSVPFLERDGRCVLKPADSRGARGVSLIEVSNQDFEIRFLEAVAHSPLNTVIAEEYIAGPQLSTETLVIDGETFHLGFSDRNYDKLEQFKPYFIENGGSLPSHLSGEIIEEVKRQLDVVAGTLGLRNAVVKGDVVVRDGKPFILEVALRLSGGYFCTHEIPLNTGIDFVGLAIKNLSGIKIDASELQATKTNYVEQRYFFPKPGLVVDIFDKSAYLSEFPDLLEIRVEVGDVIKATKAHPDRAGVVICSGATKADAVKRVEEAIDSINIVTVDEVVE